MECVNNEMCEQFHAKLPYLYWAHSYSDYEFMDIDYENQMANISVNIWIWITGILSWKARIDVIVW